jgi:MoxR-like ATPase
MTTLKPQEAVEQVAAFAAKVVDNVEKVVVGKTPQVQTAVAAILAQGHVLLEDAPGVAKTVLVKSLAKSLGLSFKRIQCTPDLLPSDAVGASVYNQKTVDFEFRPGPVFANLVLVDELNRATPRTQAALLECMAERQVTVDNKTYPMAHPFLVFATQNPFEYEGTFPLPEAQLDRFAIRMRIGYPDELQELQLLENTRERHPLESIGSVSSEEEALSAQEAVKQVFVHEDIRRFIVRLARGSRTHGDVLIGASPRASMALFHMAQAATAVAAKEYVTPDIVRYLAPMVLEHRLTLKPEARMRGRTPANVVHDILERTPAPTPGKL